MVLFVLTLVVLSTVASLSYKFANNDRLSPARRRAILAAHAFFIEAIQIALLVACIFVTVCIAGTSQQFRMTMISRAVPPWLAVFTTAITYALAILATDVMDTLIQLHTLQHPIQSQTLILTRGILLPQTVLRRVRRPPQTTTRRRRRTMSEPGTPTIPQQISRDPPRRASALQPGTVTKLVSTFEEVFSCTAALSGLEQQIPSTVHELEGSSVSRSTDEQTRTPEPTTEIASTMHREDPVSEDILQESPSMKQKIEPVQHQKAARHTQARVEARMRQRAQDSSP